MDTEKSFDQEVRLYVYNHFVERERPPTVGETAAGLNADLVRVTQAYERLHQKHTLFLEPGSDDIRMANPFSAVPTPFRVSIRGRAWWANCAWDALGIPAMLHADAAQVVTTCAESHEPIILQVENDHAHGQGEVAHFALPFKQWYDDIAFT